MSEETKKNSVDIFQYINIIRRRKWFFVTPLLVIYFGFLVTGLILPKIFETQAIVLIEEKKAVNPLLSSLAVSSTVSARMNALREEILSWPRLFQLVERLGMDTKVKNNPLELEKRINEIRKSIILTMKSPEVLVISFRDRNPAKTQQLTNTLCDILIERNVVSQADETTSAIDFLKDQIKLYQDKLNKSDEALRKFKEVYGQASDAVNKLPLDKVSQEIAKDEADLVMALVDCTEDHPRVKELRARIESLKQTRNEYVQDLAKRAGVNPENYVNIADSAPRQEEEFVRLTREKAVNERIYQMFLERMESAKITESLDQSENRTKFRVIEPARLPLVPVQPNLLQLNFLGILVGAMVGFGLVYLLEFSNSALKNESDLKDQFGIDVFGSISQIVTAEEIEHKKKIRKKVTPYIVGGVAVILLLGIIVNALMMHL